MKTAVAYSKRTPERSVRRVTLVCRQFSALHNWYYVGDVSKEQQGPKPGLLLNKPPNLRPTISRCCGARSEVLVIFSS
jgi:hypothetical protein